MKKTLIAESLSDIDTVAKTILEDIDGYNVVALSGKMGAGKTTLIKAMCKTLGVTDVVSSPTFALVNEYRTANGDPVFHFDFYRVESVEEVYDIGYEEYIYSGNLCLIEWPEMMMELLPENHVNLSIEETENGVRSITYHLPV